MFPAVKTRPFLRVAQFGSFLLRLAVGTSLALVSTVSSAQTADEYRVPIPGVDEPEINEVPRPGEPGSDSPPEQNERQEPPSYAPSVDDSDNADDSGVSASTPPATEEPATTSAPSTVPSTSDAQSTTLPSDADQDVPLVQESEDKERAAPRAGKIYFVPVPVFGVNPALGTIFGAGMSLSYYFGDPKTTQLSNMIAGLTYTTLGQLINTYKSFVYLKDNSWVLIGDWRYLNTSQPTYGLGTGPASAKLVTSGQDIEYNDNVFTGPMSESQMLEYKYFRFYQTVMKKVVDSFYVGAGYHLDYYSDIKDNLLDLEAGIVTAHYAYSFLHGFDPSHDVLSGFSLDTLVDSRDSSVNPSLGTYFLASFRMNAEFLGSDQGSSSLWLEYRKYLDLSAGQARDIVAFWAYGNFTTSGSLPYLDLPATSYDQFAKAGRGYVQGRFRGRHLLYAETEYRRHLFDAWTVPIGAVAFFNLQSASALENQIHLLDYVEPGGGLGLRFMLQKATLANLAIDYGFGNYKSQGLFIRVNETF